MVVGAGMKAGDRWLPRVLRKNTFQNTKLNTGGTDAKTFFRLKMKHFLIDTSPKILDMQSTWKLLRIIYAYCNLSGC